MKKSLPPILTRTDFDSDEEFEIYQSSEAGEWVSSGDLEQQRKMWKDSAKATIHEKRSRISLSIPDRNLARLKSQALRQGVPYQTLINQVLHQFLRQGEKIKR